MTCAGVRPAVVVSEVLVSSVFEVDVTRSSRELFHALRDLMVGSSTTMPESTAWHLYLELRRRGEARAGSTFLHVLRRLHEQRQVGASPLPALDPSRDDHRLVDDAFLGEMWKAYKRCIVEGRTGPMVQILREMEPRVGA